VECTLGLRHEKIEFNLLLANLALQIRDLLLRELRDTFRDLVYADAIKSVVITGAGGNFCSGGDVHEIIGPLVEMRSGDMGLLAFTRMTVDLVKAMRACSQPIVAAVDGICAGAGAILAMASDLRLGTARSKVAFLFRAGRLGRRGYGCLQHVAENHRDWTRGRAALYRPQHGRQRGRAVRSPLSKVTD